MLGALGCRVFGFRVGFRGFEVAGFRASGFVGLRERVSAFASGLLGFGVLLEP